MLSKRSFAYEGLFNFPFNNNCPQWINCKFYCAQKSPWLVCMCRYVCVCVFVYVYWCLFLCFLFVFPCSLYSLFSFIWQGLIFPRGYLLIGLSFFCFQSLAQLLILNSTWKPALSFKALYTKHKLPRFCNFWTSVGGTIYDAIWRIYFILTVILYPLVITVLVEIFYDLL